MRQKTVIAKLLQSVAEILQSASGITKCDRLLLQSASGITKCDVTSVVISQEYNCVVPNSSSYVKRTLNIWYI